MLVCTIRQEYKQMTHIIIHNSQRGIEYTNKQTDKQNETERVYGARIDRHTREKRERRRTTHHTRQLVERTKSLHHQPAAPPTCTNITNCKNWIDCVRTCVVVVVVAVIIIAEEDGRRSRRKQDRPELDNGTRARSR